MHEPTFFLDDVEARATGERIRDIWCDEHAVSEAEWSALRLRDRLTVGPVTLKLIGGEMVQGKITAVYSDALMLENHTLIPLARIECCFRNEHDEGVSNGFPIGSIASRLSGRSALRCWINEAITARFASGGAISGRLLRVAADHVELETDRGNAIVVSRCVSAWLLRH